MVWLLLATMGTLVWVAVGIPTWHIRPFTPQTDDGMAWSYALRSWGPLVTSVGVAVTVLVVAVGWRAASRLPQRLALLLVLGLVIAPAWFVRQNHFEWRFAPLADVAYAATSEASFLADAEMVMGVQVGTASVAFPVRQLAYHHVVNTTIADEPVVATY
jgi:hypothetical protein